MRNHLTVAGYSLLCLWPTVARFAPDVAHLLSQLATTRDRDQKERLARGLRGGKS